MSSHTGAAALNQFPRYLADHDIQTIAATGGLIGLRPYNQPGRGVSTLDELARHAEHIANLVGVDHQCVGTDMNGVPGLVKGYHGPRDMPRLLDALERVGFSDIEIDLSAKNAKELREHLQPWVNAGRRTGGSRRRRGVGTGGASIDRKQADLRRLEGVAGRAARSARGAPEIAISLSTVRTRYDELMLRTARSPNATLGQRLYAARPARRADSRGGRQRHRVVGGAYHRRRSRRAGRPEGRGPSGIVDCHARRPLSSSSPSAAPGTPKTG